MMCYCNIHKNVVILHVVILPTDNIILGGLAVVYAEVGWNQENKRKSAKIGTYTFLFCPYGLVLVIGG